MLLQQRAEQIQKKMASALRAANEADQRVTQALSMLKSTILDVTRAGEDPRQTMWRAVWEVNPHEVDGRRSLADIMKRYQVTKDPDGMTHFPDGFLEWVAKQLGKEPREVAESEKRALEELLRSRGIKGLIMFENNFNAAAEPPRSWAPGGGWQDGHGDAWRHAYWNALMPVTLEQNGQRNLPLLTNGSLTRIPVHVRQWTSITTKSDGRSHFSIRMRPTKSWPDMSDRPLQKAGWW